MNIIEIFSSIADSIREKLGNSNKIIPSNYSTEISKIVTSTVVDKDNSGTTDIAFHSVWTTQQIDSLSWSNTTGDVGNSTGDNAVIINSTSNNVNSYSKSLTRSILGEITITGAGSYTIRKIDRFINDALFHVKDGAPYILKYNNTLTRSSFGSDEKYTYFANAANNKYLHIIHNPVMIVDSYNTSYTKTSQTGYTSGSYTTSAGWVGAYVIYFPYMTWTDSSTNVRTWGDAYTIDESLTQSSFDHGHYDLTPGYGNDTFKFPVSLYNKNSTKPDYLLIQYSHENGTTNILTPTTITSSLTISSFDSIKGDYWQFTNIIRYKQFAVYDGKAYTFNNANNYLSIIDNSITMLDPINLPYYTSFSALATAGEYLICAGGYYSGFTPQSDTNDDDIMIIPSLEGYYTYGIDKVAAINYLE